MLFLRELSAIIYQEFILEWKLKSALTSTFVYVGGMVFMIALSYHEGVSIKVWFTTFWIIQLFISLQVIGKSFLNETEGQLIYRYQFTNAFNLILGKIIYNILLGFFFISLSSFFFIAFLGFPIPYFTEFSIVLCLGILNLSSCITLLSALVSATGSRVSLLPALSFPVLFPQIMLLIRLTDQAAGGVLFSKDIFYACSLALINIGISLILFPILWKQ